MLLFDAVTDPELLIMVALPWVMSPLLAGNGVSIGLHWAPPTREGLHLAVRLLGGHLVSLKGRHV